ncbi:MAG: ribbon-helix-helix domain-containing protein, partial [Candidatus Levybacteria bacterium]|nr:ribbon-helix-helix domain-containing protein [Candidatus Levybacteria bacterium]
MYMQTQTFNIALPKELVKKIDKVANKEYRNRSELIREALRVYLAKIEKWDKILTVGKEYGRKAGIKSEEDVN